MPPRTWMKMMINAQAHFGRKRTCSVRAKSTRQKTMKPTTTTAMTISTTGIEEWAAARTVGYALESMRVTATFYDSRCCSVVT